MSSRRLRPSPPAASNSAGSMEQMGARERTCELSLVVPAFDEEASLPRLHARVHEALGGGSWELILVDDGSGDRTAEVIRALTRRDPRVVGVFLGRNHGQTAALAVGAGEARGRLIATLDADLQNDPADIPHLIACLQDNDAVVGYRLRRQDAFVRRASSRVANWIRNRLSGDHIRDTGCALRLFRAEALAAIPWFEGMHRFLPTLLRYQGYRVIEVPVSHHPRAAGRSKYGIKNRAWRAWKDLLAVRWMRQRMIHFPAHEVLRALPPSARA